MLGPGNTVQKLARLLVAPTVEPGQRAARIQAVEKDVVLPIKGLLIAILIYYFFFSQWNDSPDSGRDVALKWIRGYFLFYVLFNAIAATIFIAFQKLTLRSMEWLVFGLGLLDGVLLGALAFTSNGFDSVLYWAFPALILHNALAIPVATPQIALNVLVCCCYIFGGMADKTISLSDGTADALAGKRRPAVRHHQRERPAAHGPDLGSEEMARAQSVAGVSVNTNNQQASVLEKTNVSESDYSLARSKSLDDYAATHIENPRDRLIVLVLWALCCYGIQVLFEKQKRAEAEATEFAVRQERLHTAGRLAAEIAHQLKNPLGIITNAAFCLQRAVHQGETAVDEQIQIIREEVERSDQIITELMGYAQLAEGIVERLDVAEELDAAIQQVVPSAAKYQIEVRRDYAESLPILLMQRRHLSGVFVNVLQNAREAMNGVGQIEVTARYGDNDSFTVVISDNGPGIPPDKIDKIFEAYFTTREKGTGLGLAIVKHNTEMYGGTVNVYSELGKGTRFVIQFPARILMKIST
jgi:signal transduction histidine kinase